MGRSQGIVVPREFPLLDGSDVIKHETDARVKHGDGALLTGQVLGGC